jgi:uncharacterized repeat protein (TIGR01451 family)
VTATDTVSTPISPVPAIALEKVADTAGPVAAGDQITYTFLVTNTGNVTLTNVRVIDRMLGTVTCAVTTLVPGESTTCTAAPYTVTATDVREGSVLNRAVARANGGGGAEVTANDQVTVATQAPPAPSIGLVKTSDASGPVEVGEEIGYSFTVTNTGNTTLTDIVVDDPMLGAVTCARTTLGPGASTTCTAPPYTVTAQDVDATRIRNHATVRGISPDGTEVDSDATLVIPTRAATPPLPDTGSPVSPVLPLIAFGMLGAGASLILAGRRKRDREP